MQKFIIIGGYVDIADNCIKGGDCRRLFGRLERISIIFNNNIIQKKNFLAGRVHETLRPVFFGARRLYAYTSYFDVQMMMSFIIKIK